MMQLTQTEFFGGKEAKEWGEINRMKGKFWTNLIFNTKLQTGA